MDFSELSETATAIPDDGAGVDEIAMKTAPGDAAEQRSCGGGSLPAPATRKASKSSSW
jgi:hypothetical protein